MSGPPIRVRRMLLTYEPSIWNVHDITVAEGSRINNICEQWNNAFKKLVDHAHSTIRRAIDSMRKDQALVTTPLSRDCRGDPPANCKRSFKMGHSHQAGYTTQALFRQEPGYENNS